MENWNSNNPKVGPSAPKLYVSDRDWGQQNKTGPAANRAVGARGAQQLPKRCSGILRRPVQSLISSNTYCRALFHKHKSSSPPSSFHSGVSPPAGVRRDFMACVHVCHAPFLSALIYRFTFNLLVSGFARPLMTDTNAKHTPPPPDVLPCFLPPY